MVFVGYWAAVGAVVCAFAGAAAVDDEVVVLAGAPLEDVFVDGAGFVTVFAAVDGAFCWAAELAAALVEAPVLV